MEKLSRAEIKERQDKHELWLSSNSSQGSKANYSGTIIKIVNFREAELSQSDFSGSKLKTVEFVDTILRDANFENSELVKIDFHNADLAGANFKGAKFKKVHINEDTLDVMRGDLTPEQIDGIITSYKVFMRKMIFG